MNISKKTKQVILYLALVVLISSSGGCNFTGSEANTMRILPPLDASEYLAIPMENYRKLAEDAVKDVIKDYEELELKEITVTEDRLLLKRKSYLKAIDNIYVNIFMNIEDNQDGGEEEMVESFFNDFSDKFDRYDVDEMVRIKGIDFIFLDESLNKGSNYSQGNEDYNKLTLIQDERLNVLDKLIYNEFKDNLDEVLDSEQESVIKRMGKDGNKFIVEITILYGNVTNKDMYDKEYLNEMFKEVNKRTIENIQNSNEGIKTLNSIAINKVEFTYIVKGVHGLSTLI